MTKAACSDQEFVQLIQSQSIARTAEQLGVSEREIYRRRRRVEERMNMSLTPALAPASTYPQRASHKIKDGIVIVGGDAHYWPGQPSTAHRAIVWAIKEFRPKAFVFNGDAIDGATISRYPAIGWEGRPSVEEELAIVQERLGELELATAKTPRFWTLGNHDARFEMRLAQVAPEYKGVRGVHLHDHFPLWTPCWAVECGPDPGAPLYSNLIVKHRFKGGMHATHNNALWSGRSIATNHLHSLKVTPLTDYNGTRYGVDCGCLCDPRSQAFAYAEDNPTNWRPGFAIFTWKDGKLLWPEVLAVHDEDARKVEFRGKVFKV